MMYFVSLEQSQVEFLLGKLYLIFHSGEVTDEWGDCWSTGLAEEFFVESMVVQIDPRILNSP